MFLGLSVSGVARRKSLPSFFWEKVIKPPQRLSLFPKCSSSIAPAKNTFDRRINEVNSLKVSILSLIDIINNDVDHVSPKQDRNSIIKLVHMLKLKMVKFNNLCIDLKKDLPDLKKDLLIILQYEYIRIVRMIAQLDEKIFQIMGNLNSNSYELVDLIDIIKNKNILTTLLTDNLQVELHLLYVQNLYFRFERGEISYEKYKEISIKLSQIVHEFSNFKKDTPDLKIHSICKYVLRINQFLFKKYRSVNIFPLMNPENIIKFKLEEKISEIVQDDVIHYYFQRRALAEAKNKMMGGDEYGELSEIYVKKRVSEIVSVPSHLDIVHTILRDLIWISIYGYIYLYEDELKRERVVKRIFGEYKFKIPELSGENLQGDAYKALQIPINYIILFSELITKELKNLGYKTNPFMSLTAVQVAELKVFLDRFYDSAEDYPKSILTWMSEFIKDEYRAFLISR